MQEFLITSPELECESEIIYRIEKQERVLNFDEYSKLVQTLNKEQKEIFHIILKWWKSQKIT